MAHRYKESIEIDTYEENIDANCLPSPSVFERDRNARRLFQRHKPPPPELVTTTRTLSLFNPTLPSIHVATTLIAYGTGEVMSLPPRKHRSNGSNSSDSQCSSTSASTQQAYEMSFDPKIDYFARACMTMGEHILQQQAASRGGSNNGNMGPVRMESKEAIAAIGRAHLVGLYGQPWREKFYEESGL